MIDEEFVGEDDNKIYKNKYFLAFYTGELKFRRMKKQRFEISSVKVVPISVALKELNYSKKIALLEALEMMKF